MGETRHEVRTTCPYCGVGCGILAARDAAGAVAVRGDPGHPANSGRLCAKGLALGETVGLEGRLLHPEVDGVRASWDVALDLVAARFSAAIAGHGPDSVALYVSGQFLTEDYYVANKLMKGFIGSANIDTNSRLCMASTVAGHRRAFGTDTVPGAYEDLELADLVVLVGSNLAWCHPVLYQRLAAAKTARPGMRVVVVDPRTTASCEIADLHLALAPDTDAALFNGLLARLAALGALDRAFIAGHTTGFDAALARAGSDDIAAVAAATGLDARDVEAFYALFAAREKTVTVFSQGVNQSVGGTDKVNAILNCHLATGRIGRPGTGPFSVTGQPNAMGGREVGGLANMLAAHMDIDDPGHRALVADFWRAPALASAPGLKALDMFRATAEGRIKALWIMATNPVDSLPDAGMAEAALRACPFVVVSDMRGDTDTARHAHVRLPAATWGEKSGTVTNSERCISRQRAFLPVPGEARPDWWALTQVARRMGWPTAFPYQRPADIFREHAALSAHGNGGRRAFDIGALAGLSDAGYEALAPVQWPCPAGAEDGATTRFFAGGRFFTRDGRARFVAVAAPPCAAGPRRYPLTLNTGRIRDQWHTMTRTGLSPRLAGHLAEPFAEIHPDDAAALGIAPAQLVTVESARGRLVVRALVTGRQRRGSVFVPMHWSDSFAARGRVNMLVSDARDPWSGQPGLKRTPVMVRPVAAAWHGFAVCRRRPSRIEADYWALARARGGYRIELAGLAPLAEPESFARALFGAHGVRETEGELVSYSDAASAAYRFALFAGGRLAGALYLSRTPVAVSRSWVTGALDAGAGQAAGRLCLLAGRAAGDSPDPGAIVCSCFDVGIGQIVAAVVRGGHMSVEAVGRALGAGTGCGSCRGEIAALVASAGTPANGSAEAYHSRRSAGFASSTGSCSSRA